MNTFYVFISLGLYNVISNNRASSSVDKTHNPSFTKSKSTWKDPKSRFNKKHNFLRWIKTPINQINMYKNLHGFEAGRLDLRFFQGFAFLGLLYLPVQLTRHPPPFPSAQLTLSAHSKLPTLSSGTLICLQIIVLAIPSKWRTTQSKTLKFKTKKNPN